MKKDIFLIGIGVWITFNVILWGTVLSCSAATNTPIDLASNYMIVTLVMWGACSFLLLMFTVVLSLNNTEQTEK